MEALVVVGCEREKKTEHLKLFICFKAETNIYFYTSSAMENKMIICFYFKFVLYECSIQSQKAANKKAILILLCVAGGCVRF